ncbi:MAG: metalloregulator ArsR/SmtB family transcription factor [Cystobacterineae bacterium]|nr:metalloregulator ArsR/SmtB family transcription factor [Cystobacterineae bacterium]
MEEKAKQIAELLKVLANENRLMIFCGLMQQPLTVSEIAKCVPKISQSALSQHLSLLKAHGILDSHKNGQNVTYAIADGRVTEVINVLKKYYCSPPESHKHPLAVCLLQNVSVHSISIK